MTEKFTAFFETKNLRKPGNRFLAAVSGGVDSVVLCELCKRAGLNFYIAHCNFGLRGPESERDETFVKQLGKKYSVNVLVKKFDTESYAFTHKCSIQVAARQLRYAWFTQLIEIEPAAILLGHHANDNIETLLMNFFRGTGLEGLTGIKEVNPDAHIFRPMLSFTRQEIENFAHEHHLQWVEDSSNASSKYTRNFFRNELIPLVKKVYPHVESNLQANIKRFGEINQFYQSSIKHLIQSICERHGEEVRIPVKKLLNLYFPSVMYEIFSAYGFGEKQIDEIFKLLHASSGKYIENEKFQVIRHRKWLLITPRVPESASIAIGKDINSVHFQNGRLQISFLDKNDSIVNPSSSTAQLDAKQIVFPLLLRKWKQGDYFYPLGMRKKKKIARFLIDNKLSKYQKENVWVMESDKKIFWIVGLRIDDRFKITPATSHLLQLTISNP